MVWGLSETIATFCRTNRFTRVDAAGVSHYLQMTQELGRLQGEIRDLEGANEGLREEISRINHDPFMIEKLARERLGFVKEGEIVYQLVDPQ